MNTRDERYSALLWDLGMGVLPTPAAEGFTHADLMQCVSKYRGFYNDTPAEEAAPVAEFPYPVTLRRRRR